MRIFLYGTLMDPEVARRVSGDDRFVREAQPALLPGWRKTLLRGTPFPTLVPDDGSVVHGLLAKVSPRTLARLHAYEGRLYRFVTVHVLSAGRRLAARAWIAPPWRALR
ncbi:MAG: gamma-glutamylcyclotransferase [Elioraea sp.]|nr:gamma-glutamylcyclotransferase [Elioraea sp.]